MGIKLNKERRLFLAILAVALVALAVDRFTSAGSPATAAADVYTATPSPSAQALRASQTAQPQPAATLATPPITPVATLAHQLQEVRDQLGLSIEQVPDAFTPSWNRITTKAAKPAPTPEQVAAAFKQSHRLTAVMAAPGGGSIAVINGKLMQLGDSVDGLTLTGVTHGLATLQGPDGVLVTLDLAQRAK